MDVPHSPLDAGLDPAALRTLAAAVRAGTFDAAARELHVTPSAVSQRVKALERRVGRVLLHRTRPIEPTPAGHVLVRLAARRAIRPGGLNPAEQAPSTLRATLLTCLALTYLNPHVYLDTVLLLGSVAQQHPHRWVFGIGAAAASLVWFTALGAGAHKLAPVLARPGAWRILDGLIAVVMVAVAITLLA